MKSEENSKSRRSNATKTKEWQPDFIGIGTMKAASAWLFQCLREHPEISGTRKKELHFFDQDANYKKGLDYYRSHFSGDGIIGEFTPSYLSNENSASRIHSHFPDVKLIACLRDPSDRAWSHYRYALQMHGRLSAYKNFEDAYSNDRSLSQMGRYAEQLERYHQYYPKEQIKIVFYDDLLSDPLKVARELYVFLGTVDCQFTPKSATDRRNQTGDRTVVVKHKRAWDGLLKARRIIQDYPKIEALFQNYGLISKVRNHMNRHTSVTRSSTGSIPHVTMSKSERDMVIKDLHSDITRLELLTGRELSKWKL